ncbi:SDR family oxidoreductase [Psychrobacter celer]|uniref:SDR family oxidoreductase n=1 Tax=Psychrobacter celer TaxID=306572 RepID=UPI001865A70A|nr:SDR family oxidoreductase [Psychrobacter celer]
MNNLLSDKRIVISGAARGLGLSFATACAHQGAEVVMLDILEDDVKAQADLLKKQGLKAVSAQIDLASSSSITASVEKLIAQNNQVDGLINCGALATGVGGKNMMDYDEDLWDRVMQINVKGSWLLSKALVPYLKASGSGKIVNIASDTALWGAPNLMAYTASKGAIIAMTRSMARELGESNICVNCIAPGLTIVEATAYVPQQRHDQYVQGRALNRKQYPEDIDGTAVYLLSDLSSFVTGQNIPVNGGFVFN